MYVLYFEGDTKVGLTNLKSFSNHITECGPNQWDSSGQQAENQSNMPPKTNNKVKNTVKLKHFYICVYVNTES